MRFTVLGGGGFVGSHMARHLRRSGHEVLLPARGDIPSSDRSLGHVVYAIGLTGDFRTRPYDTIEAHVTVLSHWLREASFESFLYLSSTRVYGGLPPGCLADETTPLILHPSRDSLYDLSKLLGEALCLGHASARVRVARLSNVFGQGQSKATFLGSILAELARSGWVEIRETADSSKDYVAIEDVLVLLERIAIGGRERLYNVASGRSTRHAEIAACLASCGAGAVSFAEGVLTRIFPEISIARVVQEFAYTPRNVVDHLPELVSAGRHESNKYGDRA